MRTRFGLSQEALAARLGVSFTTVNRWESNRARPRTRTLEAIAALAASHTPRAQLPARNVPAVMNGFFGRERELAAVDALLETAPVVTLAGPAGCGKTRLVEEVVRGRSGIVWYVELASIQTPESVAAAINAALGATTGEDPSDVLVTRLAGAAGLLVLDNCEHVLTACADLARAIARRCPHVQVLVTSREPLHLEEESVLRLGLLKLPSSSDYSALIRSPAVEMFADRARRCAPEFALDARTAPLVAQICRTLEGLPLAIELAAARCGSLSLTDLRDKLDGSLELLAASNRSTPGRHQTLDAALEWSFALLDESEQRTLARLGVFAGRFELDAAEAVCDEPGVAVRVSNLVDRSLVQFQDSDGHGRYLLLDAVRVFARRKLNEASATDETRLRHAEFYLKLGDEPPTGTGEWESRLRREIDDFRQAVQTLTVANDSRVIRLLGAATRFFSYYGNAAEGRALLADAIARCLSAEPGVARRALFAAGVSCMAAGQLLPARDHFEQALSLDRDATAVASDAELMSALALVDHYLGDYAGSIVRQRAALEHAKDGPLAIRVAALATLGWTQANAGDTEAAATTLAEARALYESLGHVQGLTMAEVYTGDLELFRGNVAAGRYWLTKAGTDARERHEVYWEHICDVRLSQFSVMQGDPEGAMTQLVEAYERHRAAIAGLGSLAFALFLSSALAPRRPQAAAVLMGAFDRTRTNLGFSIPAIWRDTYERAQRLTVKALGVTRRDEALARSGAQALEAAIGEAVTVAKTHLDDFKASQGWGASVMTSREREVLALLAGGASTKEIAAQLRISPRTVERHLANLYSRIGARGRADAIAWALREMGELRHS